MKELTLYKIKEMALNSGRAVYSTSQLSNLIGKSYPVSSVYLKRLENLVWQSVCLGEKYHLWIMIL